ncbi:hypothetical protein BB561_003004 [Smittium simulii]|uniref:Thioredoxin domain-containing protein n=1 Tax=Smittium simulii TaxID=133385 RepID=A0A2T9YNJ0_9FUNG|nr:hypothetical protein BB561_003004 [Smittium simulii]
MSSFVSNSAFLLSYAFLFALAALGISASSYPEHFKTLDQHNFHSSISTGVWVVAFLDAPFDDSVNSELKNELFKTNDAWNGDSAPLSKTLKNVSFGAVNCKDSPSVCFSKNSELNTYPTLISFLDGVNYKTKTDAINYESISSFVELAASKYNLESAANIILDSNNFQKLVGIPDSIWIVKFHSPNCGWCRRLAPIWTRFSNTHAKKARSNGLFFGEVNCLEFRDVCVQNVIEGYPTVFTFVNGKKLEEFNQPNDEGKFEAYISNLITKYPKSNNAVIPSTENTASSAEKKNVAESITSIELTPDNYQKEIDNSLHFIKFYNPNCPGCITIAPLWDDAVKQLEGVDTLKIAQLNCKAYSNFCIELGVIGVPRIRLVYKNRSLTFDENASAKSYVDFATQGQGIDPSNNQHKSKSAGKQILLSLKTKDNSEFLVFAQSESDQTISNDSALKTIKRVATKTLLLNSLYISSNSDAAASLSAIVGSYKNVPQLLYIKNQQVYRYDGKLDQEDSIMEWVNSELKTPTSNAVDRIVKDQIILDKPAQVKDVDNKPDSNIDSNPNNYINKDSPPKYLKEHERLSQQESPSFFDSPMSFIFIIIAILAVAYVIRKKLFVSKRKSYIPMHKGD